MKSDLISIIVPLYNSELYINRCLDSLLKQTYKNIEIIIVDDGSKDNSLQLIKDYANKDSRIKIYTQSNQGPSVARNTGLDNSTGKYIMFVDADDFIDKNMVANMVEGIKDDKNTLVLCDNSEIWINKTDERKLFDTDNNHINKVEVIKAIASGRAGLVCGKLFNKNIIKEHNIKFDKEIKMCEDQIFFLNISRYCDNFIYIPKSLYFYDRRNESSITIKYQEKAIDNQIYVINRIKEILKKSDLEFDDIKQIINNRYIGAIDYCINNEVLDTKIYNIREKISNINNIIQNTDIKKEIEKRFPLNRRENIIIKSCKNGSYIKIFSIFYILERIVYPFKRSMRKLIKI